MPRKKQKKSIFLFEIGCEELPPSYAKDAILQLERIAARVFSEARLHFDKISCFGTPRRICLMVEDLSVKQNPEKEEILGPPKTRAFDEKGNPTETFYGFLRKLKIAKKDIHIKKTLKGEYLCAIKEKPVLNTAALLPALCREITNSFQFPKTMRWADSFSFARPIRWATVFFDNKPVEIKIADVISSNYTFGHRLLSDKKIKISNPADYLKLMKKHKVLVDPKVREEVIMSQLKKAVCKIEAEPKFETNLLEEIVYLTEWPFGFIGSFKKKYLKLPSEVLLASMSKNQRIFALFKKNGQPLSNFAAVIDNNPAKSKLGAIKVNYENILEAKLKDAEFFYGHDTRTKLEDKNAELDKLVFHKDLGSMLEKVKRLKELSVYMACQLNLAEKDKDSIARCAWLSKADLVTEMVKEFPSLQGIMGSYYAKKNGEPKEIVFGIKEHYLPRFSFDDLPKTKYGSIVGFVDKLDTIVSCFAINLTPTGSYDPYALRRHGQGLVRIALSSKFNIDITKLISLDIELLGKKVKKEPALLKEEVFSFLKERIKPFLIEQAKREDLVEAVLGATFDNFVNAIEKVKQLSAILNSKDFFNAYKVVERTANILKPSRQTLPEPNPSLFKEKLERDLFDAYQSKKDEILNLISKTKYALASKVYGAAFFDILHVFFDKVLINVENDKIKQNRMAIMEAINKLYTQGIADISRIKLT